MLTVSEAVRILNEEIVYKPSWKIQARSHTKRFQRTIAVRIEYPCQNSNLEDAKLGYPNSIVTYAEFPITLGQDWGHLELCRALIESIMKIEEHEAREFLRLPNLENWRAPFHPHSVLGIERWGAGRESDVLFGRV